MCGMKPYQENFSRPSLTENRNQIPPLVFLKSMGSVTVERKLMDLSYSSDGSSNTVVIPVYRS